MTRSKEAQQLNEDTINRVLHYKKIVLRHGEVKLGETKPIETHEIENGWLKRQDERVVMQAGEAFRDLGFLVETRNPQELSQAVAEWTISLSRYNLAHNNKASSLRLIVKPIAHANTTGFYPGEVKLVPDPSRVYMTLGEYAELVKEVRGY